MSLFVADQDQPTDGSTAALDYGMDRTQVSSMIDALEVAEKLFAAIQRADVDALREVYAPAATIWHNHDQKTQSVDENLAVLAWVVKNIRDLRYTDVRRQRTEAGFVQQHVLRGTAANGARLEIPACIVCTVAGGRITRLEEYLDSGHVMPLLKGASQNP